MEPDDSVDNLQRQGVVRNKLGSKLVYRVNLNDDGSMSRIDVCMGYRQPDEFRFRLRPDYQNDFPMALRRRRQSQLFNRLVFKDELNRALPFGRAYQSAKVPVVGFADGVFHPNAVVVRRFNRDKRRRADRLGNDHRRPDARLPDALNSHRRGTEVWLVSE